MSRNNRSLFVLGMVAAPLLAMCGCGGGDDDSGPSEAGLQSAAQSYAGALADHDYVAAYQKRSARCRLTLNQEDFEASMGQKYDGRNLAAQQPEVAVTVSGETGQVTTKFLDAAAAQDDSKPAKWSFTDGKWQFDNC